MNIAPWRWYDIGRFRILSLPLPTNPYWATHRIFYKGTLIASQLSVPSLQQCEDRLSEHLNPPQPSTSWWKGWTRRRGGRPTNAERARKEALETA